jgi:signal transduction histidine kinase
MNPATEIRAGQATPADVLRDVAHELRQPLSTIESIAYYLAMVLPRTDERAQAQLAAIRQLVEQSNWILTSALGLAGSTPVSERADVDFEELITQAAASLAGPDRPCVRLALAGALPSVHLDPVQGRELAESLLMLARQLSVRGDVTVSTSAPASGGAEAILTAPGHGNYPASGTGSTLGLENARRIAEIHGGTLELEATPETGIRLRVMLP